MTIHLWHTHRLIKELATDSVTQVDSLKYMLLGVFLYVQTNYIGVWIGAYRDWGYVFEALLVLTIGLIGTHECFKANGGQSGRAFILRFSALAVPVGLKLAIVSSIVSQLVYYGFGYVVTPSVFRDPEFVYRLLSFVLPPVWTFVYYWRIAYHIGRIHRVDESET